MFNSSLTKKLLKKHEGNVMVASRHIMYRCPADKNTVGYGRNLDDRGLSQDEADFLLDNDITDCLRDLMLVFSGTWHSYSEDIKAALIDMRFALGATGFRKWKRFIKATKELNHEKMIKEIEDSNWYRGIGYNRLNDLIKLIKQDGEIYGNLQ